MSHTDDFVFQYLLTLNFLHWPFRHLPRDKSLEQEFIKLGQALKLAELVSDGVEAKYVINDGLVKVNGEVDTRRGRKVYGGDVISYNGQDVKVLSGNE